MQRQRGWRLVLLVMLAALFVGVMPAVGSADAGVPPAVSDDTPAGPDGEDKTPAGPGGEEAGLDGGQGQEGEQEEEHWWDAFDPRDWVGDIVARVTDRVQQVITEKSVDATTTFVRAALYPANAEMLTLAGLAAARIPPGNLGVLRKLWSDLWWSSVAILMVVTLVQAIRVAADRAPDGGRSRWVEWLLYPLAGAVLGRSSLFMVDALVLIQNELWQGALVDASPCALLYGVCPGEGGLPLAGAALGLFPWVMTMIPVLLLSFLLALNWLFLALAMLAGPIYFALSASGRTPEPMAGWLGVVVRSALVQSWVGVALFVLMLFREAGQDPGAAGAFVRGLDSAGLLRFAVISLLDLVVIYWWLIPTFRAATDMVTLRGGQVLEATGAFAGVLGTILAGAGVVTGNPALAAAGSKAAMFGRTASSMGSGMRQEAETRRQAREQSEGGGWIAQAGAAATTIRESDLATRTVAGLPPVAPYRVAPAGPGAGPGVFKVSAAPGLAGAVVSAMLARGFRVQPESREFAAPAQDADRVRSVLASVLSGDGGPIREEKEAVRAHGLSPDEAEAVAAALKRAGVEPQIIEGGLQVARKDAEALRRAVVQAVTHAAVTGERMRFTLPGEQAASALAALDKAGVQVLAADGEFRAIARLQGKGQQAPDPAAARDAARKALAEAERAALTHRPGYYRYGGRFVVVRPGQPIQTVDHPPENGVYLGEWPRWGAPASERVSGARRSGRDIHLGEEK